MRSLRLALRRIRQTPWSSLAVVAVSSVGIAGVASVFSIVNTAWLRPLPDEWANRLVAVEGVDPGGWVISSLPRRRADREAWGRRPSGHGGVR